MSPRPPAKYAALAAFLTQQPLDVRAVTLTLTEIEQLIGAPLPLQGHAGSWWVNSSANRHPQAWLGVGWRVQRTDFRQVPPAAFVRQVPA